MPSLRVNEASEHSEDLAGAACWSCKRELFTASDDGTLRRWSIKGIHLQQCSVRQVEDKPNSGYSITALHAPAQDTTSTLAAACSDGHLRLLSYMGKPEHVTDAAHDGSIICVRWNRNGTAVATGGEDGTVKTWSAIGMIRATVAQRDKPIYGLAWSPDNASIAYTCGSYVHVEAAECATSKPSQWQALESVTAQAGGVLLAIDWSSLHGHIITGGEDCRYAVWDQNGILLFRSERLDHPPLSVVWRPQGDTFLVGLHNKMLLCDAAGWVAAHSRHTAGGAQAIAWAPGGMRCGVATGSGKVIFGSVLDLEEQDGTCNICLKDTGAIDVSDVLTGINESLEFSEPVDTFALGHGRLLVATGSQVRVYKVGSGVGSMTPAATIATHELLLDIQISERCFMLLMATSGPQVYDYQGKILCSPKPQAIPLDALNSCNVALSPDTLAFLHPVTHTSIYFCTIPGGAETKEPLRIRREDDSRRLVSDGSVAVMDIVSIALSQSGSQTDRLLVFSDANSDLYIAAAMAPSPIKLAASVSSFRWNDSCDILAATSDGQLLLWYCPQAALAAHDLLNLTKESRSVAWGPTPVIEAFGGSTLTIRQREGTRKAGAASAGAVLLHKLLQAGRWRGALQLCRARGESLLWAILAALAVKAGQLEAANAAFASIDQVDKVSYLQTMETIPNHHIRRAELLLLQGKHPAAEEVLMSNHLIWAAVDLNVRLFYWDRALSIAQESKDPMHVQGVLWLRAHHLRMLNKDPLKPGKQHECLDKFARLFQEQGVPIEKPVKSFIHEQSINEGLIAA